jgi:hypothetical protein
VISGALRPSAVKERAGRARCGIAVGRHETHPDAVVIAEEWEGYSVAALLSRRGKRVSLLTIPREAPSLPEPFSCAEGPSLYFGFEKGGLAEALFSELALSMPLLRQEAVYTWVSPPLQIILPSHRVDFSSDREELMDEFKRELASHHRAIGELLAELDEREALIYPAIGQISSLEPIGIRDRLVLFNEKWSQRRLVRSCRAEKALTVVRRHLSDPKWELFLGLLSLFVFRKRLSEMTLLDLLILHGGAKRGVVRLVEGEKRLGKILANVVTAHRGEVIPVRAPVKIRKAERGGEVTIEGGRVLRAPEIIAALPEAAIDQEASAASDSGRLLIGFEVDSEVIPDPMKEDLILCWEGDSAPIAHNFLAVRLTLPAEETGFKIGTRALVASAYLTAEEFSPERLPRIEREIEERVRWLLPFSGERLRRAASFRVPAPSRLRSIVEPAVLSSLKPVRAGAALYYRSSRIRGLTYIPTLGAGAVDRLAFVMSALDLVQAGSKR